MERHPEMTLCQYVKTNISDCLVQEQVLHRAETVGQVDVHQAAGGELGQPGLVAGDGGGVQQREGSRLVRQLRLGTECTPNCIM